MITPEWWMLDDCTEITLQSQSIMEFCIIGVNGERIDPESGYYHLGNGYRAYSPASPRFTCPDSMSPFGGGGINAYSYCSGDPVNHADPSGHLNWQSWLSIGIGLADLGLGILTCSASIAAAGGIMAMIESASAASLAVGTLGMVSDVAAITSSATDVSHPEAASALCWVALALGGADLAQGFYSAGKAGFRGLKTLGHVVSEWQYRLQHAGGCISVRRASTSEISAVNTPSEQIQRLLQINSEMRLFPVRGSMAAEYQEIASPENIYRLNKNPLGESHYTMTNLKETHGRYPDGIYAYVIRADRENDVLLGKIPEVPGGSPGPSEIAGHTSMTRDSANTNPVDVYYAGELSFRRGTLLWWNNVSGHYKPSSFWAGRNMVPGIRRLLPMSKFKEEYF